MNVFSQVDVKVIQNLFFLLYTLWLVKRTYVILVTNQMQNENQSQPDHSRFPALQAPHVYYILFSFWPFW